MKSIFDDSESDILDDDLTKEDKALIVSNLKKFQNEFLSIQKLIQAMRGREKKITRDFRTMKRRRRRNCWVKLHTIAITVVVRITLQRSVEGEE